MARRGVWLPWNMPNYRDENGHDPSLDSWELGSRVADALSKENEAPDQARLHYLTRTEDVVMGEGCGIRVLSPALWSDDGE